MFPKKIVYEKMSYEKKFTDKFLSESMRLGTLLDSLQTQLKKFPDGKLVCNKNGIYHKYYVKINDSLHYIRKTESALIEKLAIKKYLTSLTEDIQQDKQAIDTYLKHENSYRRKSIDMLNDTPKYQQFLLPFFKDTSNHFAEWSNEPYEHNTNHPEMLIHKTVSGNIVRSKSESLIDMALFTKKIPYRYECVLHLETLDFYPDFTMRHPETGKIMYWEHFGMMDDSSYSQSTFSKLQIYNTHGIIPSINLITTFETRKHPLTSSEIERVIQHHLL